MELFRSRSLFPLHGLRKKVGMCFVARSRCGSVGSIAIYIGFVHSLFLDMSCKIVAAATATVDCINVCANYGWQHGV